MRRGVGVRAGLAALLLSGVLMAATAPAPAGEHPAPLDFPDPFVAAVDDGYVAVATSPHRGTLTVPLRRSTDLKRWSDPVEALAQRASWASRASVWAPALFNPEPGRWLLYYSVPHLPSRSRCISVAVAARAEGPYVDDSVAPLTCDEARGGAIDPEAFRDDEGRDWLVWKTEGRPDDVEAALWSQQLGSDGLSLVGSRRPLLERRLDWELPLIENPSMFFQDGGWKLMYSAGVWQNETYKVGLARCHSPAGPCERLLDRPLLASGRGLAGPGGASVFRDRANRLRVAFHAWAPERVGYEHGGSRGLHLAAVGPGARLGADPVGALDGLHRLADGSLQVRGWAADADDHSPIQVHLYAGGRGTAVLWATGTRPDVERAHPGLGAGRGFDAAVGGVPAGAEVCAFAINTGLGSNRLLGCRRAPR